MRPRYHAVDVLPTRVMLLSFCAFKRIKRDRVKKHVTTRLSLAYLFSRINEASHVKKER